MRIAVLAFALSSCAGPSTVAPQRSADLRARVGPSVLVAPTVAVLDHQVADLDGDAQPELVVLTAGSVELYRWSDGLVPLASLPLPPDWPPIPGVGVGDVDGDGDADIVVGIRAHDVGDVMLNQAALLVFDGVPGQLPAGAGRIDLLPGMDDSFRPVAIGDVSGDGIDDVVLEEWRPYEPEEVRPWLVLGGWTPGLTAAPSTLRCPDALSRHFPLLVDADGDGHRDVVLECEHDVVWFRGSATGLAPGETLYTGDSFYPAFDVLPGVGGGRLIVRSGSQLLVRSWPWSAAHPDDVNLSFGSDAARILHGELDGLPGPEIVAISQDEGRLAQVFRGWDQGVVEPVVVVSGHVKIVWSRSSTRESPPLAAVGDLDGDGLDDLALRPGGPWGLLLASPTFPEPAFGDRDAATALVVEGDAGVALADLDDDGWLDWLVVLRGPEASSCRVDVHLGGPAGPDPLAAASLGPAICPDLWGVDLDVADLDGDGLLDVVVTSVDGGQGAVSTWTAALGPSFSEGVSWLVNADVSEVNVEPVDVDLNGTLDLVVGGTSVVRVLHPDDPGRRDEPMLADANGRASRVVVADLDGDGLPDVTSAYAPWGGTDFRLLRRAEPGPAGLVAQAPFSSGGRDEVIGFGDFAGTPSPILGGREAMYTTGGWGFPSVDFPYLRLPSPVGGPGRWMVYARTTDSAFIGLAKAADVTGDGHDDLLWATRVPDASFVDGAGASVEPVVWSSVPRGASWTSGLSPDGTNADNWLPFDVGDLDHDGTDDVVVASRCGAGLTCLLRLWGSASGPGVAPASADEDGDGYPRSVDCDDADPAVSPAAVDPTDRSHDANCDGLAWCRADLDGDGWPAGPAFVSDDWRCQSWQLHGPIEGGEDCDDTLSYVNPGMAEGGRVGGMDYDCDGLARCYLDLDGDGAPGGTEGMRPAPCADEPTDCDDADPTRSPLVAETVGDNIDSSCDGSEVCYYDVDQDGRRDTWLGTVNGGWCEVGELATAPEDYCDGPDATGDADGDLVCDVVDLCPGDSDSDRDGDGVCAGDRCNGFDAQGDRNRDGWCDGAAFKMWRSGTSTANGVRSLNFRVVGAAPRRRVALVRSVLRPPGSTCASPGVCVDLAGARVVATATTDASGRATLEVIEPVTVPFDYHWFQAVQVAGGRAYVSPVVLQFD